MHSDLRAFYAACSVPSIAAVVQIQHNISYLWYNKNFHFHFNLNQFGELISQICVGLFFSLHSLNEDLHQPKFSVQGGERYTSWGSTNGSQEYSFFLEWDYDAETSLYVHNNVSCRDSP
jgi:hypothetical protein